MCDVGTPPLLNVAFSLSRPEVLPHVFYKRHTDYVNIL